MSRCKFHDRKNRGNKDEVLFAQIGRNRRRILRLVVFFFGGAIAGALLGFFFLPGKLGAVGREGGLYVGGGIGIALVIIILSIWEILANPKQVLGNFWANLPEDLVTTFLRNPGGCCSLRFVLLITLMCATCSLFIWHTLLLAIIVGASTTFFATLIFVVLGVIDWKETPSTNTQML